MVTNLYVWAARNPYLNIDYEPISINRPRWDGITMPDSAQRLSRCPASSRPLQIFTAWSLWQIINRQYLISGSFLQDIIPIIFMWLKFNHPFASNLGMGNNWNPLDYPWIFTVPLRLTLYIESCLCLPTSSVCSHADCIHIVIHQIRDPWE
jgi:hypothetical protein